MKTNITYITLALAALAVTWVAFPPTSRAQLSPPPDGAYPNGNTAEGDKVLFNLTDGIFNTAVGFQAMIENTTGGENTAIGDQALRNNVSGNRNTALGGGALGTNDADDNTACGYFALTRNKSGVQNTATGSHVLIFNTTGNDNTANGFQALNQNVNGFNNTASGVNSLFTNTSGFNNTGTGVTALFGNTTGFNNTATGFTALQNNTTGSSNTADGDGALASNTTGSTNTACGISALLKNTTGKNNIALGASAGSNLTTGNNNIEIGANVTGNAGEANTIRMGKQGTQKSTFVAGIFGTAVTGTAVVVNSTGKLGVATSSARFKEAIKPMGTASEAILALNPVTFRYKEEVDPDRAAQFGLVAEDVEKVDPKLVIHDEQGKPFTVHYEAVNAMLLNEFLKEHRKVQQLEANALEQQKQIDALTAAVRKMSVQLERDKANLSVSGPSLAERPSDSTLEGRLMKGQ